MGVALKLLHARKAFIPVPQLDEGVVRGGEEHRESGMHGNAPMYTCDMCFMCVCVYVSVRERVRVRVRVPVRVRVRVRVRVHVRVCVHVCVRVRLRVRVRVCMRVRVYLPAHKKHLSQGKAATLHGSVLCFPVCVV